MLGRMAHTCNPSTQEVEAGGAEVQGHPQLCDSSRAALATKDCLPKKKKKKKVAQQVITPAAKERDLGLVPEPHARDRTNSCKLSSGLHTHHSTCTK